MNFLTPLANYHFCYKAKKSDEININFFDILKKEASFQNWPQSQSFDVQTFCSYGFFPIIDEVTR